MQGEIHCVMFVIFCINQLRSFSEAGVRFMLPWKIATNCEQCPISSKPAEQTATDAQVESPVRKQIKALVVHMSGKNRSEAQKIR